MKVSVEQRGPLYIGAVLTTSKGSIVLRRWPWPNDEIGRSRHHRGASVYAHGVAWALECDVEVFTREDAA